MKTAGIVGGLGPESTIAYYRFLHEAYRARHADGSAPPVVIDSVDFQRALAFVTSGDTAGLTGYLVSSVKRLARAGAAAGLVAANTPHIVFDDLRRASPIPLVSIVEATRDDARARGLGRLGLFGTRFTMQGAFYPDVFSRSGLTLVVPRPEDQDFIHDRYLGELVKGVLLPATRAGLLAIVDRMRREDGIEGLILGGTELPLILTDAERDGLPFLDTSRIHVEALADLLWPLGAD